MHVGSYSLRNAVAITNARRERCPRQVNCENQAILQFEQKRQGSIPLVPLILLTPSSYSKPLPRTLNDGILQGNSGTAAKALLRTESSLEPLEQGPRKMVV